MTQLELAFILLALFQVKQFAADFPLQTRYMLRKVSPSWDFVRPLALHCAVHSGLTLAICLWVNPSLWWLSIVDFIGHFAMDRIKASPHLLGRYGKEQSWAYWMTFGFDQMVHHLTHLAIVWYIVNHTQIS